MKKPKKFKQGRRIPNMNKLGKELAVGNWIFIHSKPKHPSVMVSMTYRTLSLMVNEGILRRAILLEEAP